MNDILTIATERQLSITDPELARWLDSQDKIGHMRSMFAYPTMRSLGVVDESLVNPSDECLYLCGHSLGLMPKKALDNVQEQLKVWSDMGVYHHFQGSLPAATCEVQVIPRLAKILGATEKEVCIMNGLSVNIHLLMVSFYRPTKERHKILIESKAFPSDHYAVESQLRFHGYDPADSMLFVELQEGEDCFRNEDILNTIREYGSSIALIWLSGVQYYTGQLLDISSITSEGHEQGCVVGWDLAHAVGNVPLKLHEWNVDFAVYCSYKYMNCGAGTTGGIFLHEEHARHSYPRFEGWWSHDINTRFKMDNERNLMEGARSYGCSNVSAIHACLWQASLEVYSIVPFDDIRDKSVLLTGYLEALIKHFYGKNSPHRKTAVFCSIMTPADPDQRGAQLSLKFSISIDKVFEELKKRGVVCDKRLPAVIRVSPVPLYTCFGDVYKFIEVLQTVLEICSVTG